MCFCVFYDIWNAASDALSQFAALDLQVSVSEDGRRLCVGDLGVDLPAEVAALVPAVRRPLSIANGTESLSSLELEPRNPSRCRDISLQAPQHSPWAGRI